MKNNLIPKPYKYILVIVLLIKTHTEFLDAIPITIPIPKLEPSAPYSVILLN